MNLICDFKDIKKIRNKKPFEVEELFINSADYKEFLIEYRESFTLHLFDAWESRVGNMSDSDRISFIAGENSSKLELLKDCCELYSVLKCHVNLINGETGKAGTLNNTKVYISNDVTEGQAKLELRTSEDAKERLVAVTGILEHISEVSYAINTFREQLKSRANKHDNSKLSEEEIQFFAKYTPLLKGSTYGTDGYFELLKKLKPALDHHYANNRHHPEYFEKGILDMNLVDIVEMFCDWAAAVKRHDDGNIFKSLEHNRKRFNMDDQLFSILKNTADLFK